MCRHKRLRSRRRASLLQHRRLTAQQLISPQGTRRPPAVLLRHVLPGAHHHRSPRRSDGFRGVGRPPICSGHIGINSWRRASSSTQSCGLDAPSYRQGRPSRHAEIRIFILSPPHNPVFPLKLPVKPSRRPASVVRRQHRLQAHDPGLTQRRQQAVQFPAPNRRIPASSLRWAHHSLCQSFPGLRLPALNHSSPSPPARPLRRTAEQYPPPLRSPAAFQIQTAIPFFTALPASRSGPHFPADPQRNTISGRKTVRRNPAAAERFYLPPT